MPPPEEGPKGPTVTETHLSVVVALGERVLKFHKPVAFEFVDFSTLAARAADCRREVELNRRLAPDVYEGVADLVLDGAVVDAAVVMRRMPASRRLSSLVAGGTPLGPDLGRLAAVLAAFHAGAARSPEIAAASAPDFLAARLARDTAECARFAGAVLDPQQWASVTDLAGRFLAGRGPLLEQRIAEGHVCDGHGDLQADDVYCLDDGPRILDCLEFDDQLRYGDVAADLAFLLMDLERLGAADAAAQLRAAYERAAGVRLPDGLLHFYVGWRALVRVKVACLRHEQGDAAAAPEARSFLDLALAHLRAAQPLLVLVGGLPGSGKTTLAEALAARTGAVLIGSDTVRARSVPGPERYTPERVEAVYRELAAEARRLLGLGRSVVLDATWRARADRQLARQVAAATWSVLVELRCVVADRAAEARIGDRLAAGTGGSEATVEVRRSMAAQADPWPGAIDVDTSASAGRSLATALDAVRRATGAVGG